MAAPQGLFSGLTPEAIAAQEAAKQRETNLSLAQSANPLAGSLYSSYNMADETKKNIADIFGNPVEDSPQVKAAKDEQQTQQQIAQIMAEGNSQGLGKAEIAAKVKEFLLSKNKVDKAMQYESLNLNADKTQSEIEKNKAQTDEATQKAMVNKAALLEPATRLASLKAKFPNVDIKILEGAAQDPKSFIDFMTGRNVETAEGIYTVRPVGAPERIGSAVDKRISISTGEKGNAAFVQKVAEGLPAIESAINNNNQFIGSLQQAKERAIKTAATMDRYTGSTGEAKRFVASTLSGFGLLPPSELQKLINSDAFESEAANLLLTKTGGKIGAGFSNTDLETVRKSIGSALQDPKALVQIISDLEKTTAKTNGYLKNQYQRGLQSMKEGAPLPLDSSFDTPVAPPSIRQQTFKKGTPEYAAYQNDPKYREYVDSMLKKQGKILVLE